MTKSPAGLGGPESRPRSAPGPASRVCREPSLLLPPLPQAGGAPGRLQPALTGLGILSRGCVQASALSSLPDWATQPPPSLLALLRPWVLPLKRHQEPPLPRPRFFPAPHREEGICPESPLTMRACPVSVLAPQEAPGGVPAQTRLQTPCCAPSMSSGRLYPGPPNQRRP